MTGTLLERPTELRQLCGASLFAGCEPEDLHALAQIAEKRTARRKTIIAEHGAPFPYLGVVCDGVIGVSLHAGGPIRGVHRLLLYQSHAHETFGEIGILDGVAPLGEISVLSKTATYLLLPADAVLQVTVKDPAFMQRLAAKGASRARELTDRLSRQHGWSVAARVAAVLLEYADEREGMQPANPRLSHFRQRDIAAAAGCVKEAAARAIAELEDRGALRRERGHIRYLNRNELLKYSENS